MLIPIQRIFLMLGSACNLQCKYCLQHDMADNDSKKVNAPVIDWIKKQAQYQSIPIKITFYGGEPLVYWDAIADAVEQLEGRVIFSIITNGKLLDEEKVNFCNDHDFRVAVSYDGKHVIDTRGYDVVMDNPAILRLNHLSLSAVLSKYTYPKDFLDALEPFFDSYRHLHSSYPSLNIDTIMDFGNCAELRDMDLQEVSRQMKEVMEGGKPVYEILRARLLSSNIFFFNGKMEYATCGNGISVWNIDTEGNVYRCHNCGEKLGTIHDSAASILIRAGRKDPTLENQETCKDCPVYPLCKGGCPLIDKTGRDSYYCDIKRAYYQPVMDFANRQDEIGKEIIIK